MSNLRDDCREIVKDLPVGDTIRSHMERVCNQLDYIESLWHKANKRLAECRAILETAVCIHEPDVGVVLLSQDSPTHTERMNDRSFQVYDLDYFSPLGEALIAAWSKCEVVA